MSSAWARYQSRLNASTDGSWQPYARHRRMLTDAVLEAWTETQGSDGPLVVLGAGNCNDLDLHAIVGVSDDVLLLDVDDSAMARGLARQGIGTGGPVATRSADVLDPRSTAGLDARVVLSACMLTQLIDHVVVSSGHANFERDLLQVRDEHLATMSRIAMDGGLCLLATDVVSSASCPRLLTVSGPSDLSDLLRDCLTTGNFFSGTNPHAIAARLIQLGASSVDVGTLWKWRLGDEERLVSLVRWRPRRQGLLSHAWTGAASTGNYFWAPANATSN